VYLSGKGVYNKIADDEYLKKKFYAKMGYKLDLSNPKTFNEKMQWLKLYDRNLDYVKMVDKYEVKEYVASVIGKKYIIPTIAYWDNIDDIDIPEKKYIINYDNFKNIMAYKNISQKKDLSKKISDE